MPGEGDEAILHVSEQSQETLILNLNAYLARTYVELR